MNVEEIIRTFEENPSVFTPKVVETLIWVVKNSRKADVIIGKVPSDTKERVEIMRELFDNDLGELAVLAVYGLVHAKGELLEG